MHQLICKKSLRTLLLAGFSTAAIQACGAKSDEAASAAASTTSTTVTTEGITSAVNALSEAYPGALALSVFPEGGTALRLAETEESYADKVEGADKRLRGEGDCFVAGMLGEHNPPPAVTCYEFDSDMDPTTNPMVPNGSFGTKDGTDGAGQACMVSFAKAQVDDVTHTVDRALAMIQGVLCKAKKDATAAGKEVEKPTPDGEAIDFAEAANASLPSDAPISFSTAEISAVTNDDASITYTTSIAILNPFGKTDSITLRHTPAVEEGGAESGVLSFQREPLGTKLPGYKPNDPNSSDKKFDVMSINYQKSTDDAGAAHMVAELAHAAISQDFDPLDDDGLVNFAALPDSASNAQINAIKYVSFDINPETGEGDLSYWMNPGGSLQESARGFLFNMTADDSGLLTGCGISGATQNVSIRMAAADSAVQLAPVRFWHPFAGQNTNPDRDNRYPGNEGNLITEQCFAQDSTSGVYEIDPIKSPSVRGYEVIAGSASEVRPPERPPEPMLPPPPPPSAPK